MKLYKYMRALDSVICPNLENCCKFSSNQQKISDRLQRMIEYSAIFFSDPLTFNDPFDAHFSIDTEDKSEWDNIIATFDEVATQLIKEGKCTEKRANDFRTNLNNQLPLENYRVSCFSSNGNNELMWAHYADQHRGVILCYEFDSLKNVIQYRDNHYVFIDNGSIDSYSTNSEQYKILLDKVIYSSEKPKMKFEKGLLVESYNIAIPLFTKSLNWSYEEEIRLALQVPFNHGFDEKNYYIMLDKNCLKSIVFGERLDNSYRYEIVNLINNSGYENVTFLESVIDAKTFSFKQQEYNLKNKQ